MEMYLLETSLNLRIEPEKSNTDYSHNPDVAEVQRCVLSPVSGIIEPDIIVNVEDMDCDDVEYKSKLSSYTPIEALDDFQKRGVSCYVKKRYKVQKIASMESPHMLHVRIQFGEGEKDYLHLIAFRILVSNSSISDFQDRKIQFEKVMAYIDSLQDKRNLIITGDWNHGVISQRGIYPPNCPRYYFNYHYILQMLQEREILLTPISGFSYRGYMKIDHMAVSEDIVVLEAQYADLFENFPQEIGIPDHKSIIAKLQL